MRVTQSVVRHKRHKRVLKAVQGSWGNRGKLYRTAKEHLKRMLEYAYRDRRVRKREFRGIWITRISTACQERGIRYSVFMNKLATLSIKLNRKSLSEIASRDKKAFDELVILVKQGD